MKWTPRVVAALNSCINILAHKPARASVALDAYAIGYTDDTIDICRFESLLGAMIGLTIATLKVPLAVANVEKSWSLTYRDVGLKA